MANYFLWRLRQYLQQDFFLEAMAQRGSLKHVFFKHLAKFSEKHLYLNPFLVDVGL